MSWQSRQLKQNSWWSRSLGYFFSKWKCLVAVLCTLLISCYKFQNRVPSKLNYFWRAWCGLTFAWASVSVLTVLLLLHTAFCSLPGFKEPSGFWTPLDVMTSVVRLMFVSSSQFHTFRKFWTSELTSSKQFYLGDLIDIQIKQWSEKNGLFFNLQVMLIGKILFLVLGG